MSSQYENLGQLALWTDFFKVTPPALPAEHQMRVRRIGGFIRAKARPQDPAADLAVSEPSACVVAEDGAEVGAQVAAPVSRAAPVEREWVAAQWGLVPSWVKSASDARLRAAKLLQARNESVSTTQAFRDAWLAGQRCIIPMQAFYEDDLRSGKPVATRIARVDGQPMGVAGIWSRWCDPQTGEELMSYALLTVNANSHALMRRYQHPGSEKRMPAILGEGSYDAWLSARQDKAREFMRAYPANWLLANPVENKKDKKPKGLLG
ncbi:SOS response-associated peptidase [Comamonas composti]|uniref:SOS response-associated peptidase n=1 Tax=Comamonas composti TaxID=408558 RepID=UPI00041C26A9|nr:SOS response-associated peptidase family protein [Comamonas composti]